MPQPGHPEKPERRPQDGFQPQPEDDGGVVTLRGGPVPALGDIAPTADEPEETEEISAQANGGKHARWGWRFSLDDIVPKIEKCKPEGKLAIREAVLWCTNPAHPVHIEEFCQRVGIHEGTLYKIFTGKYTHPTTKLRLDIPEKLIKGIRHFLSTEKMRAAAGKTEFVVTPTVKKIWTACDLARESQTPVFITGPSHNGKTWALERYSEQNNHGRSPYIRMKAASGLGGMVKMIATSLGISPKSNTADLLDRIQAALSPDMVLILDEVHLLQYTYRISSFFACMEVLRELLDRSRCGAVFCGTKLLLEKLQQGEHKEMEQIMRRGVHRLRLPDVTPVADLEAIFQRVGLDFPKPDLSFEIKDVTEKPYDVLRQLSAKSGLKSITERLRYGRKLANRAGDPLDWSHFTEAHLIIGSNDLDDKTGLEMSHGTYALSAEAKAQAALDGAAPDPMAAPAVPAMLRPMALCRPTTFGEQGRSIRVEVEFIDGKGDAASFSRLVSFSLAEASFKDAALAGLSECMKAAQKAGAL